MMCMHCLNIQPVGPVCSTASCNGFPMAKFYCSSCNLFDDDRYKNFIQNNTCMLSIIGANKFGFFLNLLFVD